MLREARVHPTLPARDLQRAGEHTQLGFVVEDIVREVADLKSHGVVFEEYDLPGLKTVDGIAQAGPNQAAWMKDSEGNVFLGIVQFSSEI